MDVIRSVEQMRAWRGGVTGRVALVPTMGALHEGHLSLIRRAREVADAVVVSVFVNPTQFAPHEDLERYPRPIERDIELCEQEGAAAVFNPSVEQVYPPGEVELLVDVPAMGGVLEGAFRPHFFGGVCRVVAKLFGMVQPDVACFGEKDYQQLRIIEAMVAGLSLPIHIEACPLVRDEDGLALSSRNVYLDAAERERGLALNAALVEATGMIEAGVRGVGVIEEAMREVMVSRSVEVDYAVVRDPRTLGQMEWVEGRVVCLVAGRVGPVRLIDNRVVGR